MSVVTPVEIGRRQLGSAKVSQTAPASSMFSGKHGGDMDRVDYVEAWSLAVDHLKTAIVRRLQHEGKPGYRLAYADYCCALGAYNIATEDMLAAIDT